MPVSEQTRMMTQLVRVLCQALASSDVPQVTRTLLRLNSIDSQVQFETSRGVVCVRLMHDRTHAPVGVMHVAEYVERLHLDGSLEVLKNREGIASPWHLEVTLEPSTAWDHLMNDGS